MSSPPHQRRPAQYGFRVRSRDQCLTQCQDLVSNIERVLHTYPTLLPSQTRQPLLNMTSQSTTVAAFFEAKADFLNTAREAKATDGIINNGHEMETELVSTRRTLDFSWLIIVHRLLLSKWGTQRGSLEKRRRWRNSGSSATSWLKTWTPAFQKRTGGNK